MRLSDIMGQAGLAGYAEVGLVLFLGVFLAVAARTLFLTSNSVHLSQARIPLDSDIPFDRDIPLEAEGNESQRRTLP